MFRGLGNVLFSVVLLFVAEQDGLADELNVAYSNHQVGIGFGYNPVTGEFKRPCIKIESAVANPAEVAKYTKNIDIEEIKSASDLRNSLKLNAYASVFGGTGSLSSDISKITSSGFSSSETYLSIRIDVNGIERSIPADIGFTDDGKAALKKGQGFFKRYCGDSYVTSIRSGGQLIALLTLENASSDDVNNLKASLQASYGTGKLAAETSSELQKIQQRTHLKVSIAQSGFTGQNIDVKTIGNVESLIDYALKFSESLSNEGAKPSAKSVIYEKYSNSVAFGLILEGDFQNFDPSQDIIGSLISSYDIATQRADQLRQALSSPSNYKKFDAAVAQAALVKILASEKKIAGLAEACAQATGNGEQCTLPSAGDLIVEEVPTDVIAIPACNLATFIQAHGSAANVCADVRLVDGQCVCVECNLFASPPYSGPEPRNWPDSCKWMQPNSKVSASLGAKVSVSPNAADHWYALNFNGKLVINQGNLLGNQSEVPSNLPDDLQTDGDGTFTATLSLTHCQSNVHQSDTCTFEKSRPSDPSMLKVRAGQ